jgi:hypothetical protein
MRRDSSLIWWILGALVILGGSVTYTMSRGLRNNNPGNIREGKGDSTLWVGERATDDDPLFEEFTTMPYGIRAATQLFRNYQRLYGLHTIAQLISRWAPPSENDTTAYISSVVDRVGLDPNAPIDLHGPAIYPFLRAVFWQENGPLAETRITESELRYGVSLAA